MTLLIGAVATTLLAAVSIQRRTHQPARRAAISGVLMPDAHRYRELVLRLLARKRPERLRGLIISGDSGRVRLLRFQPGRPSFLSSYLNPKILEVLARATGASTDAPITITDLRLVVSAESGHQRWHLNGTRAEAPWHATVNPNGTSFHHLAAAPRDAT